MGDSQCSVCLIQVELLRNWGLRKRSRVGTSGRNTPLQTGMILHDLERNTEEVHLDNLNHQGVLLHPDIYIGGIGVDVVGRYSMPSSISVCLCVVGRYSMSSCIPVQVSGPTAVSYT